MNLRIACSAPTGSPSFSRTLVSNQYARESAGLSRATRSSTTRAWANCPAWIRWVAVASDGMVAGSNDRSQDATCTAQAIVCRILPALGENSRRYPGYRAAMSCRLYSLPTRTNEQAATMRDNPARSIADIVATAEHGEFAMAEQEARAYLGRQPDDELAWSVLGFSLLQQGRAHEAAAAYEEASRKFPGNPLHWNNLGTACRQSGRLREAEAAYVRALQLQDNPQFHANLGLLYLEWKRVLAARDHLWRAFQLDPTDYEARIFGSQMCLECGDEDRAEQILQGWQAWVDHIDTPLRADLAGMLLRLGRNAEGEAMLRRLLDDARCGDAARARLVMALERFNRLDEARELLGQLPEPSAVHDSELRAEIIEARAVIAGRDKDVSHARVLLEKLLEEPGAERRDTMAWFLLAKVCDKQDDTAACMKYLALAHESQMRVAAQFVPELIEPSGDPMNITNYRVGGQAFRNWKPVDAPSLEESPIFVLGFPRSGTTMLEQMLDAHPGMASMDEQP